MGRFAFRTRWLLLTLFTLGSLLLAPGVRAHDVPMSYVTLHAGNNGVTAEARLPWLGVTHDVPALGGTSAPSSAISSPDLVASHKDAIADLFVTRFGIGAKGHPLRPEVQEVGPSPDGKEVRLTVFFPWAEENGVPDPPQEIHVNANLWPLAPNHKTLLSLYKGDHLEREAILSLSENDFTHTLGGRQPMIEVVRQFVRAGIHHIFIGPDHILFIIGLLLAGGTLKALFKVITGFTVAHSITLALATLHILSPSPRLIEPLIALSIVFVGIHTLRRKPGAADPRLWFAMGFGLIHGFGFASVLSELDLPRYALGTSLLSFNIGVELGQACIVLAVAPLLMLIGKRSDSLYRGVVRYGSIVVTMAGAVWFIQRILPS